MHKKKFNELTAYELYEIIKIRVDVFVVEQNCPYPECDNKDLQATHLFIKEDNKIVSYLRILPPGLSYKEASIGRVLTIKEYRGRGLSRKLVEEGIKYIINTYKESLIRISAQEYLLKFYGDLGFKPVSEIYLEDGIPHVEMLYTDEKMKS